MRSKIIRGTVLVSALTAAAVVAFIAFNAVQQDHAEAPTRLVATEGYEPSEEILEQFIPGDIVSIVAIHIEAVTASCLNGESHVLFESQEPLPSGAVITLVPSSPAYDPRAKRYSAVSDPFQATVDQPAAMFDIVLPASLRMIEYDVMFVTARATGQEGTLLSSTTKFVEPADFDCL